MRGEILAIGDELTTGQRLDTNTQWLAGQLTDLGVDVLFHTTVADDLESNVLAFRAALDRADVIVATGGLGPTEDDLTRQALAAAASVPLVEDAASLEHIRGLFASRGRYMPERNRLQAQFPAGAAPLANQHGTAPGVELSVARDDRRASVIFALPGVPAEMKPMFHQWVVPRIAALHDRPRVIRHRRLKCFGIGESHLEQMIPGLIARDRDPRVGITVSKATITLRITASGETPEECWEKTQPTEAQIRERLGTLVFGEEDDELQHVLVRMLAERNARLSVLDCLTDGLLPGWLSEADSAGLVLKHGQLGVGQPMEESQAAEAARAHRLEHGVEFALLVAPATKTHAVDSLVVALAYDQGERTKVYANLSHPDIARARAAKLAINHLRLQLLNHP